MDGSDKEFELNAILTTDCFDDPLKTVDKIVDVQITNKVYINYWTTEFFALLFLSLVSGAIFAANVVVNVPILEGKDPILPVWAFVLLIAISSILVSVMIYLPYILDTNSNIMLQAYLFYLVAQIFWSFALFHSRVDIGTGGIALVLVLCALVWLGVCSYAYVKHSIWIF